MKSILCLIGLFVIAAAYPAQEGAAYTNEAIRQAQTSHLIPQNAQIQNVSVKKIRPRVSAVQLNVESYACLPLITAIQILLSLIIISRIEREKNRRLAIAWMLN